MVKPVPGVMVRTLGAEVPTVPPTVFRVTIMLESAVTLASATVTGVAPFAVNVPLTPL